MDFSQTIPVRDFKALVAPHLADHNDPPSSSDEDGDVSLEVGRVWAYPCKHPSCPYYGKTWTLQSNFLNHLKDFKIHREEAATKDHAGRRQCAREWRYETSLEEPKRLPPLFELTDGMWDYSYRSAGGKIRCGQGTTAEVDAIQKNIQSTPGQHSSGTTSGQR